MSNAKDILEQNLECQIQLYLHSDLSSSWTKECFSANLSAQMWWLTCDKREIPCDFCLQCKLPFSTDFSRAMASFSRHCLWSFISAIRPETHWDTQIRMESYMTYIIVRQKYNSRQLFSDDSPPSKDGPSHSLTDDSHWKSIGFISNTQTQNTQTTVCSQFWWQYLNCPAMFLLLQERIVSSMMQEPTCTQQTKCWCPIIDLSHPTAQWCKVLKKNALKYYFKSFLRVSVL